MIYVFTGDDSYSQQAVLKELRAAVGPPEVLEANINRLAGHDLKLAELLAVCNAVPFLANRRLVVVTGLLGESLGKPKRRRSTREVQDKPHLWPDLVKGLQGLPPTTDLVFLEGRIDLGSPSLKELCSIAQLRDFPSKNTSELRSWIQKRVAQKGGRLTNQSIQLLVELVGPDLWTLDSDLEKLVLYCGDRPATAQDIELLVTSVREANVFTAIDAVMDGDPHVSLALVERVLAGGTAISQLIALLGRQIRLLLLAKEMLAAQIPQSELGVRLGLTSSYPLRKTLEGARRVNHGDLAAMQHRILETDINIKTGSQEEEVAITSLVADLCRIRQQPKTKHANRS